MYNNINERTVRNVYSYRANNRGNYNAGNRGNNNNDNRNNYNGNRVNNNNDNNPRPSYRGGSGVQTRPQPSEREAAHEPTAPRMNTQVQHAQTYGGMRGQYAAQNHGRPATPAVSRPIPADHSSRPASSNQSHGNSGGGNGGHHR